MRFLTTKLHRVNYIGKLIIRKQTFISECIRLNTGRVFSGSLAEF